MPNNVKYRLCGGTFFTLLSHARLPMPSKAESYAGIRSGRTEPELLWALTRIAHPDAPEKPAINEKSLKDGTRDFKACLNWGHGYFQLGDKAVHRAFDEYIRTRYREALSSMIHLVNDFIDTTKSTKKDECLVKALVEVLDKDDSIDNGQPFYVCANGGCLTKRDILETTEIYLQPFLLGIWHYVLTGVENNIVGKETYNDWCPPKGGALREYVKTLGEDSQRKITLQYCEKINVDKDVIEAEIIDENADAMKQEHMESETEMPQQTVNNPFVFNFTQNGNNNTQIGHVEHYYADKRGM